jgi:hypothetical protein
LVGGLWVREFGVGFAGHGEDVERGGAFSVPDGGADGIDLSLGVWNVDAAVYVKAFEKVGKDFRSGFCGENLCEFLAKDFRVFLVTGFDRGFGLFFCV